MRVTIIADASFCPNTHAAGYGFWIASQRGKRGGSGGIKTHVVNNIASEMMALINGLHKAQKWGLVQTGDQVLLQTDCQSAISAFEGRRNKISNQECELVQYMLKFIAAVGIQVTYKHVKGHTVGEMSKAPRHYINNQCDKWAYQAMLGVRRKIQGAVK